jgi:hypothetical protein
VIDADLCLLDQHRKWFFVNKFTNEFQWTKPTEPVYPIDEALVLSLLEAVEGSEPQLNQELKNSI